MSNRQDIAFLTPFANDAETTLPGVPIDGTSYRDPAFTALGSGWPYKTKVESQDFNQVMYIQTLLMRQLSNQGVLDYSDKEDYTANNALVKDDGGLYLCTANNGPASAVKQPSTEPLFWRRIDITEVSPLNNTWNGYLDPEHQSSLPAPNGYPGNSGGGEVVYAADEEISFGIFAGSGGATVSSDSDGWIFTGSIYKLYDYTAEQLADIDVTKVPVYLKDQAGVEYFLKHNGSSVIVTKVGSQLKVEITDDIFTVSLTKLWRWFDTESVGRVEEISPNEVEFRVRGHLLVENANGQAKISRDGKVLISGTISAGSSVVVTLPTSIDPSKPFYFATTTKTRGFNAPLWTGIDPADVTATQFTFQCSRGDQTFYYQLEASV